MVAASQCATARRGRCGSNPGIALRAAHVSWIPDSGLSYCTSENFRLVPEPDLCAAARWAHQSCLLHHLVSTGEH